MNGPTFLEILLGDLFAGFALVGLLSARRTTATADTLTIERQELCKEAYWIGEEMLRERARRQK